MYPIRENEMKERLQQSDEQTPDYETMWSHIERRVAAHKAHHTHPSTARRSASRKWAPAAIVLACCLTISVPVFAGVKINWNNLFGTQIVHTALENGIGQQYDLSKTQSGVTMNLHGVVTDNDQMKILVSLDVPNMPEFEAVAMESTLLSEDGKDAKPIYGYYSKDKDSGKLLGMYTLDDTLKEKRKDYHLNAKDLVFYQSASIPVRWKGELKQKLDLSSKEYPGLTVQSIIQDHDKVAIRYTITTAIPRDQANRRDPNLEITFQGKVVKAVSRTLLPSEGNEMLMENVYPISEDQLENASWGLSYLSDVQRIDGTWDFHYTADGKKANEAIHTQPLTPDAKLIEHSAISLQKLIVAPLSIKIPFERVGEPNLWANLGDVSFNKIALQVGDQTIDGWYQTTQNERNERNGEYFRFDTPGWYQEWSGVPMKLILKDPIVLKRDTSKNWITLQTPGKTKQHAAVQLPEGFDIQYTYYFEGDDLVVESDSSSPIFYALSQSVLRLNGDDKQILPEYRPSGPNAIGKKIEHYKDIPRDAAIEINPGIYLYRDPSREATIQIQP
ncbi:hypothetical protein BVG16_31235 [Paenibacillus selenitireducens]|uniref:Uncharacterized protein n=1 Tax=Paenibacillus selenitireducens TaxID=1324314 RepID=A0A1T2X011_9BACL|nr:DUF4179 domain-containing protein [Paenibacillus selenitireducens]OPA72933.1 hypothetical protein BVG16_31235 [Paenibacillus selenitireducens]